MTNLPTVDEMKKWKKRYKLDDSGKAVIDTVDVGEYCTVHGNEAYSLCIDMNKLHEENKELKAENEQLKKEVEMLRNGLKAYDEALPLYLDCEDIMHFKNELYEFEMERMDFYKKYPNRVHYSGGDV